MKKSYVAIALLGTCAVAQAESSVTIYGTLDTGISKKTGGATVIGRRDSNRVGFKGEEDLGEGLKALFQMETRFEPDTGTIESVSRPLFQGQSRVGVQGAFGTVRMGRGLTAYQESICAFEPWTGTPSPAGFITDIQVAGYATAFGSGSDPLGAPTNSGNRFANAVFYNTPVLDGFQLNVTVATKEANGNTSALIGTGTAQVPQYGVNAVASAHPYSVSATYNRGPFGAMAAYERNAVETKLWSLASSLVVVPNLKLVASYQAQDQGHTKLVDSDTRAWVVGANYTMGAGKLLAGYGQKSPDGVVKTKQVSIGYEYSLSKRTYVYADLSNRKQPAPGSVTVATSVNFYGVGIHHNF